jgi:hypothetical protein
MEVLDSTALIVFQVRPPSVLLNTPPMIVAA